MIRRTCAAILAPAALSRNHLMPKYFRLVCPEEQVPLVEELLQAQGYAFTPEPFSPWARRLVEGPEPLGASIAAAFGLIYIQDRSSMLAPLFLQPPAGGMVLDMCASPGGKTGFLAQLAGPEGLILANEPNQRRLATLRRNMAALNLVHVAVSRHPGESLPLAGASLSFIQLDPPCSGWGTILRRPRIREIWPAHKLKPLVDLQRRLLGRAAHLLAPGGRLLYSTCTTNPAENEDQVHWALENLGLSLSTLPRLPGVCARPSLKGSQSSLQVLPEAEGGQGFFFAALTRPDSGARVDPGPDERPALPGRIVDLREFPEHDLADWDGLPPGQAVNCKGRLIFVHDLARRLPGALRWQGFELGQTSGGRLRLRSRLRLLLPAYRPEAGLNLDDVRDLQALLQGRSLPLPGPLCGLGRSRRLGLYWRGLPLGWLTVKGARCLWSPR